MSSTVQASNFAKVLGPPPSMDWAAISVEDDLKNLEKHVDSFEIQALAWRTKTISQLNQMLDGLKADVLDQPQEWVRSMLDEGIDAVENVIKAFEPPLHSDPVIQSLIARLSGLSLNAGRFVRKLMRRVERIRVAQHAACIDLYYGLLAFKSEYQGSPEAHQTFSNSKALGTFLRQKIA